MAGLGTRIQDVIIPKVYTPYMRQEIIERSAIIQSGVTSQNELLSEKASSGGQTVEMPMWERLEGDSTEQNDGTRNPDFGKIETLQDTAIVHRREKHWSSANLASALAGSSAQDAIAAMEAEWRIREEQKFLLATLAGVFASANMGPLIADAEGKEVDATMLLYAQQLLGDNSDILSVYLVNSLTLTRLKILNLIDYIPNSRGEIAFTAYQGKRIVQDDTVAAGETYALASGVVGRGDGSPVDEVPHAVWRDEGKNIDVLTSRWTNILHIFGIRWKGTMAGKSPTLTELRTGANWERVYPTKHIGAVKIKHGTVANPFASGITGASIFGEDGSVSPLMRQMTYDPIAIMDMNVTQLRDFAKEKGIEIPAGMTGQENIRTHIEGMLHQ